ncbi:MAG: hypothetical protein ACTSQ8_25920 [Candidatus Helarchaeota archaeon]
MVQILNLFIILCVSQYVPNAIDSTILANIERENPDCFFVSHYNQFFFDNVEFYEVDTVCGVRHPSDERPQRFAIDSDNTVYSIMGWAESDYNKMINRNPICITQNIVNKYGQFFIDVTILYDEHDYGYYYISSTSHFIKLNEQLMNDENFPTRDDLDWSTIINSIHDLCDTLKFNNIIYDNVEQAFTIDYHAWMEGDGDFRHIRLKIHIDGKCEVLADSVLAPGFGYYRYIHL